MKKWIYLICSMLLLPLVSAQEILIGGKAYPLIILGPLVLVIIVWLGILLVYMWRKRHALSLVMYNLRKFFRKIGFEKISEKLKKIPLPKKEKKEEEEKKKEEAPEKDLSVHVESLSKFENQLPRLKREEAFNSFNKITRDFFSDLLNMHYEFTDEELIDELQKRKRSLVKFANNLAEMKYSGQEIDKNQIIELLDEFRYIVERHARKAAKGKVSKKTLTSEIIAQDKKIFENIKQYIDFLKTESRKKQIEDLLDEERQIVRQNIRSVKRTYNNILKLYTQLSPRERAKIFPELMGFYNDINKAIFSSVYGEKSKRKLEYFAKELDRIRKKPKKHPVSLKIKHAIATLIPEKRIEEEKPLDVLKKKKRKPRKKPSFLKELKSLIHVKPKITRPRPALLKLQRLRPKTMHELKKEEKETISAIRGIIKEDIEVERQREAIKMHLLRKKRERLAIGDFEKKVKLPKKQLEVMKKGRALDFPQLEIPAQSFESPEAEETYGPKESVMGKVTSAFKGIVSGTKKPEEVPEEIPKQKIEVRSVTKKPGLKKADRQLLHKIDSIIKEPEVVKEKETNLKETIEKIRELLKSQEVDRAKEMYSTLKPTFETLPKKEKQTLYPVILSLQKDISELEKHEEWEEKGESLEHLEDEETKLLLEIEKLKKKL